MFQWFLTFLTVYNFQIILIEQILNNLYYQWKNVGFFMYMYKNSIDFLISIFFILGTYISKAQDGVKCCYSNHIGSCVPNTGDDAKCNQLCLAQNCSKGGFCKIEGNKSPNHFCHCYC